MDTLSTKLSLSHTLTITPGEIHNSITKVLLKKLKEETEGRCMNQGYIINGSVKIVSRSLGKVQSSHFNGNVLYHVSYVADIINPLEGQVIEGQVINVNKMGILANAGEGSPPPLNILLAKQHHIDNETFENLQVGNTIKVKVLGKRFDSGEKQISIIGILEESDSKGKEKKKISDTEDGEEESEETELEKLIGSSKVDTTPIYFFSKSKDYKWVSTYNKSKEPFTFLDNKFDTIEHAFHAQKISPIMDIDNILNYKALFSVDSETYIGDDPAKAKLTGGKAYFKTNKLKMRDDWLLFRVMVIKDIARAFYNANPEFKERLVDTHPRPLIHKGFRIDKFWGVQTSGDTGQNTMGTILMELRGEFRAEEQ